MVISAPQSQPQPLHLSAEEEALKRNTDCVYFLASPLTCKKGSECEYRHSDVARVNPRDCYFWLHGNCLNPKCGFRHPPLDGVVGKQTPMSTGPSAPVPQSLVTCALQAPIVSVPCIFFQKGYCLKGHWCPFLHMPNSLSNKPSLVPLTATDPTNDKKALSGAHEKSKIQQKMTSPPNVAKCLVVAKSSAPPRITKRAATQTPVVTVLRGHRNSTHVSNGNLVNWPEPEPEPNSKDNDEISREPSPGFDVLVDGDLRDSDYYPSDDRYVLSKDHEAREGYDVGLSDEYREYAFTDDERYPGCPIGHQRGRYSSEHHQAPSELYRKPDVISQIDELDLRHRLAKYEKPNGLRSAISHENARDIDQGEDQLENTISSRLRGRIGFANNTLCGRLSPKRTIKSELHGRISDRMRGRRVDECFYNGKRHFRGRRDRAAEDSVNFAGPKSLWELKNKKNVELDRKSKIDQQSLGKRKQSHQESENDLSFEGPKPLEDILKRKRTNHGQGLKNGEIEEEEKDVTVTNEGISNMISPKGETDEEKTVEEDFVLDDGGDKTFEEEGYEPREGVWDYDLYEGDNGKYVDEDDDKDFAKKMGVMYS